MIDLGLLRTEPERMIALLKEREPSFDADRLLTLDIELRSTRHEVEELRHKKNELAQAARDGGITPELREQSQACGGQIKEKEAALKEIESSFRLLYLSCPNIPNADLPRGGKESNEVVRQIGEPHAVDFPIKNHVELGNALGWFDFDAAVRMTGANFVLYKSDAVRLLYGLSNMMLKNNVEHGYDAIIPPVLVNEKSLENAGNFPKFRDQVYAIQEDCLYATPTAEVNLTNYYRDHIIPGESLPLRMTAWTNCFRREAGAYGAQERGLIRIHQFDKVELYTICHPEKSNDELERMIACAESIVKKLGLCYRISLLAMQDCSFASAKTYDLEVWLPGQKEYYEVSSASNCTDFQARRAQIRFRDEPSAKPQLVNTLNCSSLALPRLMVAIMETYQQADGSIAIPDVILKHAPF